jgi:hypothetical protein
MHHLHGPFVQQMPMGPASNGTTTSCAAAHGNFTFPLHPWAFPHGNMMSLRGESGGDGKSDATVGDSNVNKHERGCKFQLVHSRHRRYLTWSDTCNLILANNLHWIVLWNIMLILSLKLNCNDNSKSPKQHSKSTYCNTLVSMANHFDNQSIMV